MAEEEQNYVEILDEEGNVTKCEIYDVIDFEGKTYAMLLPMDEDESNEDSEVIVMEYVEEGDDGYFQNIEDDNEFLEDEEDEEIEE